MEETSQLRILVSNIVSEKHFSHCRLCLDVTEDKQVARFDDIISYSDTEEIPVLEMLCKVFGEEVCEQVPAVESICSNCCDKTLESYIFMQQYRDSTIKLNKIIDTLNKTLEENIEITEEYKEMYVIINDEHSKIMLKKHNEKDYSSHKSKKNANKLSSSVNYAHKCRICKDHFVGINEFIEHNRMHHDLFTCTKCLQTCVDEDDINSHKESNVLFQCSFCSVITCTEKSLQQHDESSHSRYICSECGKTYKNIDKLIAHEQKHILKKQCEKCGKTYATKEFFLKHVSLCLENSIDPHPMRNKMHKKYKCLECGKGYSTIGGLKVHKRFVHGDAEPHVCPDCGKKFTAPCYLKAHLVTHTRERNFSCDMCNGKFVTKEALIYHKRRHTGEKPYSCDQCDECFVNASARADHIKFKHVGPTLSCNYCSKKFVTNTILKNHMKKHCDPTNKLYVGEQPKALSGAHKNLIELDKLQILI